MSAGKSDSFVGSLIDGVIRFCLENKLIVFLMLVVIVGLGLSVLPFDYDLKWLPRNPVPVDAIPDIGENQQIVFTKWPGRSPQDVEDQITYPLTSSLLGVPGVKSIRSHSYLGFSSIYVIFDEQTEFYWSRSRILERLSVAQKGLPEGVTPALGPDATALGQIFWYTLEGYDKEKYEKEKVHEPLGGWNLDELRSKQDWYVRYALASADGVSEVASIGGFVREYQIDVDPDLMRHYGVKLSEVYNAVRKSNVDVGARTVEINRAEYLIRGLGFIKNVDDLRKTVIKSNDNVPITIDHVAHVHQGPAMRRGALDKAGSEAVGGVVVVRYGENPLKVIKNVKQKIKDIEDSLGEKTLPDGRVSKLRIVPFYDRTVLINETLDTLKNALTEEIMVTIIIIIVMVMHLRSSVLISSLLPLAVGLAFVAMKYFHVDANLMSLAGIAIAIGTMVDMGIIICENMLRHLDEAPPKEDRLEVIFRAASEVGRPVLTAILTTVVSFLPVFFLAGEAGKLFRPLAFTKTFALLSSVIVALTILPAVAHLLFAIRIDRSLWRMIAGIGLAVAGVASWVLKLTFGWPLLWLGLVLILWGGYVACRKWIPESVALWVPRISNSLAIVAVLLVLTSHWMPLGVGKGFLPNLIFITVSISGLLSFFLIFMKIYGPLLQFFLRNKLLFYIFPTVSVVLGAIAFSNMKSEFMPPLDEGSYLYMPTTMPHASIGEALDVIAKQDIAMSKIPEVDSVVGKIGRVESPLDPAPISMVETIISYRPEYNLDPEGHAIRYRYDDAKKKFVRNEEGELVVDPRGRPYRNWRPHIRRPKDIWDEIVKAARVPGSTDAPELQPIAARIVMLQTGVRAPMAIRIRGKSLADIEKVGIEIEKLLKMAPQDASKNTSYRDLEGIDVSTVSADRIVGKPYLMIDIDRTAIARYGINIRDVQDVIETAIGGRQITTTVEGRERYGVRVRYQRELRDTIESMKRILVAANDGSQIPLEQMASINYERGPQVIKSEDLKIVGYVIFDKLEAYSQVDVVEACKLYLEEKIEKGELILPAGTEKPEFIGKYKSAITAFRTLIVMSAVALLMIFILLYLQFHSIWTTLMVWAGVAVACSGGMILLWLYSLDDFVNFSVFDVNMRDLFQVHTIYWSVAVGVGFIALLGIATDDGVVVASYLDQAFKKEQPNSIQAIREATLHAGLRRIRPCLMTTATTILALLPVLTSQGRGSDVMVPMALPSFGGMLIELMTLFVVPVSYCLVQEVRFHLRPHEELPPEPPPAVEMPIDVKVL